MERQGSCERCEDKGEYHGAECIVRKLLFNERKPLAGSPEWAMEQAIRAINRRRTAIESVNYVPYDSIELDLLVPASSC